MLKKLLLVHAVVEMLVGLLLLWDPAFTGFVDGNQAATLHMGKIYGILAFVFGVISYQLWKHYDQNEMYKRIILSIMAFHLMIGFYLFGLYRQGVMPIPIAAIFHLLMCTALAYGYMNEAVGKDPLKTDK